MSVLFNVGRNLVLHVPFSLYHGIKMNVSIFTSNISSRHISRKNMVHLSQTHPLSLCYCDGEEVYKGIYFKK